MPSTKTADRRPRDLQDALGAGEQRRCRVGQHDHPHDLAQRQGRDGQIVAADLEHRNAEDDPDDHRDEHGDRHRLPERQLGQRVGAVGHEQSGRIGADRIEGDEAQIEQPGHADLEIEPHAHEREQPDDRAAPGR